MFSDLTRTEKHHLYIALDKTTSFNTFITGPTFHLALKQAVLTRFDAAPFLLKDGYLATGGCIILNDGFRISGVTHEVNFERASSALATFRSLQVSDSHDLSIYMSLTISVVAFAES
jgi:hypothetical protein